MQRRAFAIVVWLAVNLACVPTGNTSAQAGSSPVLAGSPSLGEDVIKEITASSAVDPGPRGGSVGAGGPLAGLSTDEVNFFLGTRTRFQEVQSVSGGIEPSSGLGPTFNANSCAACHAEPAVGGTSPHPKLGFVKTPNPEIAFASLDRISPAQYQTVPSFILADGPVREARFIKNPDGSKDGGVHDLFTIAGRVDAPDCKLAQPDFAAALAKNNVVFRIPTALFGLGLVENVSDQGLMANLDSTSKAREHLGIRGRFNRSGNDGTITRFGWKAQNKSLLLFAGEAYNVEQGVTNELFPNKRAFSAGCNLNPLPEDSTNIHNPDVPTSLAGSASQMSSDMVNFAAFMRLLAPPGATTSTPSELNGAQVFASVGCNLCHTQTLVAEQSIFTGQSGLHFHPYTDVALHHMGPRLADHVSQGAAGPDEFRTAPLWGVGQRIFFLHDGRAGPKNGGLLAAVLAHRSSNSDCDDRQLLTEDGVACRSEANAVIDRFRALGASDKQDLLNFLRSL
jgi:CxxC motif-containing protein (DUF1111 family)